jgi:hypothetical protein
MDFFFDMPGDTSKQIYDLFFRGILALPAPLQNKKRIPHLNAPSSNLFYTS